MLIMLMFFALIGMALFAFEFPKSVDKVEDVPEKYRGLYAKGDDGKFALDEEVHKKTDNTGLTTALDKERKLRKDFEKQAAGWKGLGIGDSFEEAKAALEADVEDDEDEELADKHGVKKTDKKAMAKIKAEAEASVNRTKQEYEGKLTLMQVVLKKQMIDGEAKAAIAELKGASDLLLPHVRERCLLVEEDGVYQVRVVDAEGDPRSDGKGGFMTIKDLVAEMRQSEVYGRAFEAEGKTGSGTRPAGGGGSRDGSLKLTPTQKIARGLGQRK